MSQTFRSIARGPGKPWTHGVSTTHRKVGAAGKLPPGVDLEHARRLLAIFQANQLAARTWRPGPYPGRLTLLRAADAPPRPGRDPLLG